MKENDSYSSENIPTYDGPKLTLIKTESFQSDISANSNCSSNEKEITTLMKNIINKIKTYQSQNEGHTKDEEISFQIKNDLFEINKNIYNIKDDKKNTFLHILAKNSKFYPLKIICDTYYLILDEENVFYEWFLSENIEKLTVLDIASIKGNKQILTYLYSIIIRTNESILKFDDVNNKKNTFFHNSAKNNQYYSILFWYEKFQEFFPETKIFDTKNKFNLTPLHYACFENSLECVELLLDLGADVNSVDINGKSVLTYAVNSNNVKIINLLLINGADINIKDIEGKTPYDYSKDSCDKNIQLLLKNKNGINLVDNNKNIFEIILYLLIFLYFLFFFISRFIDVNNFTELFNNKYIFVGLIFLSISFLFLIITFLFIGYFSCYIKYHQHIRRHKQNLLKLYQKYNKDICVKCLRRKKESTYHCNMCDLCIDNFKFHSYWLNACITSDNYKKYILFIISIISLLISNIISEIFFLIFSFLDKDEYKKKNNLFNNFIYIYFNETDEDGSNEKIFEKNKNIKNYIFIPIFIFLLCFFIVITLIIIFKFLKKNKSNKNDNALKYGLINDEEEENKNFTNDNMSSSAGASLGD